MKLKQINEGYFQSHPQVRLTVPYPNLTHTADGDVERSGVVVNIDRDLAPLIQELWAKSFRTGGCCQGGAYYAREKRRKQQMIELGEYDPEVDTGYITFEILSDADEDRVNQLVRRIKRNIPVKVRREAGYGGSTGLVVEWPSHLTRELVEAALSSL
jgi:hypothetical protein